jgi:hypothetical protein
MDEETCLRIVDNGKLRSVDADYFDHFLLARCTTDWTKPHRLIADVMAEIWDAGHNLDATFLSWRLRELVKGNKIACDGESPMFGDPRNAPKVRLQR